MWYLQKTYMNTMHAQTYTYMRIHVEAYKYIFIHICMYLHYVYIYVSVCGDSFMCKNVCVYVSICFFRTWIMECTSLFPECLRIITITTITRNDYKNNNNNNIVNKEINK